MTTPTPVSAVLIAQNEERKVREAILSVLFCDEVVLVDSGSTDRTREVAAEAGARVIVNAPWPGFVAQRDFAVRAARHDWVLAIDADERVSDRLRREIEARRAKGFDVAGYRIPRVALYLGCWVRATDWYPDPQVRLFDRTRGAWEGVLVGGDCNIDEGPSCGGGLSCVTDGVGADGTCARFCCGDGDCSAGQKCVANDPAFGTLGVCK